MKAIGIFSTKGGTGKTTVAINLAHKLSKVGKTGLLDADIDNSNFAQFAKFNGKIDVDKNKTIILPEWNGVKVFSMSLLTGMKGISMTEDRYVQIINDAMQFGDWGDLDYLIVDLPPGSSNVWRAILKIFANVLLGDIIVTLPGVVDSFQKAIDVHKYYDIPVLAVVENMSYFECEHGSKYRLFGKPIISSLVNNIPVFELPFRLGLQENILFDHEAFDKIVEIVRNTEIKKTSFLERVKEAISKELKDEVVKVLAYIILKAQKEIDGKEIAVKHGFIEQRPFVLTITDDSMENILTRVVLRVKDGKLVVVSKPERVDFEIVASYKTLARIIMGKAKINGQIVAYDPTDAWLKGDLVVYGVGTVPRAIEIIKNVLTDEAFMSDIKSKFGKVLERWI
jgi:ATP-binding protein involved in chromosome partitioning